MNMERIDELRETWEKAYKGLVKDCSDTLTLEDIACMFFELGWRAADESMIKKACEWIKWRYTIPYTGEVDENGSPNAKAYLVWLEQTDKEANKFIKKFKKAMFK